MKSAPALRDSVKNAYHRNIDSSALKYRREINKIIGEVVKSHGNKDSSTLVNSELNQATAKEKSDIKVAVTNKLNVLNHNQLVVYGITDEDFIKYRKKHRQIKPKNCL